MRHACVRCLQLRHEWKVLDTDGSGALNLKEVTVLVRKLNCNIPKKEVRPPTGLQCTYRWPAACSRHGPAVHPCNPGAARPCVLRACMLSWRKTACVSECVRC